jgi:hypothetical protein
MLFQGSVKATIANGQSLSGSVQIPQDQTLVGIFMPAAWTTAALTFQVSLDGEATWREVVKVDGNAYQVVAAAGQMVVVPPADLLGLPGVGVLRVRSGTSGTPVAQGAARDLTLILSGDRQ